MVHGLFYQCPYYVSGSGNISVAFPSMQGQRALRFHQKYLNLCSEDEQRTYGFGTTWGWIIDDRIFILGWTNVSESSRTFLFSLSVFLKHVISSPAMQRNKEGMCFESDWHVIANEKQLFPSPPCVSRSARPTAGVSQVESSTQQLHTDSARSRNRPFFMSSFRRNNRKGTKYQKVSGL